MANKLYVPANISTQKELWNGFGAKQAAICAVLTGITIAFAAVYVKFINPGGLTKAVFAVMLACAASISLQTRIENNMSIVDYIKIMLQFQKQQQKFKYVKKQGEIFIIKNDKEGQK